MPPSLSSVPRPGTTVVENPFAVTTRTGKSTGTRGQRRVLWGTSILSIIFSSLRAFKLPRYKRTHVRQYSGRVRRFPGASGTAEARRQGYRRRSAAEKVPHNMAVKNSVFDKIRAQKKTEMRNPAEGALAHLR